MLNRRLLYFQHAEMATMNVSVSGTVPFNYTWHRTDFNGCLREKVKETLSSSSLSDTYTISSVTPANEGWHTVVVSGANACVAECASFLGLTAERLPYVNISHDGAQVTLDVPDFSGCTVYYTTDGSCPSRSKVGQGTFVYSVPFIVPSGTSIQAFATRSDRADGFMNYGTISY